MKALNGAQRAFIIKTVVIFLIANLAVFMHGTLNINMEPPVRGVFQFIIWAVCIFSGFVIGTIDMSKPEPDTKSGWVTVFRVIPKWLVIFMALATVLAIIFTFSVPVKPWFVIIGGVIAVFWMAVSVLWSKFSADDSDDSA